MRIPYTAAFIEQRTVIGDSFAHDFVLVLFEREVTLRKVSTAGSQLHPFLPNSFINPA